MLYVSTERSTCGKVKIKKLSAIILSSQGSLLEWTSWSALLAAFLWAWAHDKAKKPSLLLPWAHQSHRQNAAIQATQGHEIRRFHHRFYFQTLAGQRTALSASYLSACLLYKILMMFTDSYLCNQVNAVLSHAVIDLGKRPHGHIACVSKWCCCYRPEAYNNCWTCPEDASSSFQQQMARLSMLRACLQISSCKPL